MGFRRNPVNNGVTGDLGSALKRTFDRASPARQKFLCLSNIDCFTAPSRPKHLFLINGGDVSTLASAGYLQVRQGEKLSSGVFRNSFYLDVWRNHTSIRSVKLLVSFVGKISLRIYKSSLGRQPELLLSRLLKSEKLTEEIVDIAAVDDFVPGTRLFWDIEGIRNSAVANVSFVSGEEPERLSNLIVTIRTFGRSRDVHDLLKRLSEQAYLPQHLLMLKHVQFVFLDTSNNIKDAYKGISLPTTINLYAYTGANLGGGGNAGQLMLDVRKAVESSGVRIDSLVVLDDDLDITIESLYRYWAFACLQKGDVAMTLPVLMKSDPVCVWEDGGIWGRFGKEHGSSERMAPFPRLLRHGWRLQGFDHLDAFAKISYPEYGTFIFFAIPWKMFCDVGFPVAFFLRGDDVEYSLRVNKAGYKLVSNPNLAAWHEPAHSYAQEYMAILHGLIINMAYGVKKPEVFLEFFLDRYRSHAAILDVLGMSLYGWVLETLNSRSSILDIGFEAHYFDILKKAKALESGFEHLDQDAINDFMALRHLNRTNLSTNFVYGSVSSEASRLGSVVIRNHLTGAVKPYRSFELEHQKAFIDAARRFIDLLATFAAEFETIQEHWCRKLESTALQAFWESVEAAIPAGKRDILANWTAKDEISLPAVPKALPQFATLSSLDEPGRSGNGSAIGTPANDQEEAELPADFDADAYLHFNADVREAGVDAAVHYLKFGRKEGRRWQ